MSIREEQCNKVCRILDDVLANRPTERDSLIVAVRKAFEALELFGNSEQLPSVQPQYKPAKIEDFAKTMSEKTLYRFMAWYGEALELMEEWGFVICKKTM